MAVLACAGTVLVDVAAPLAATASPPGPAVTRAAPALQRYRIEGGVVLVDVRRDRYTIEQATDPLPGVTPVGVAQAYAASFVAARGWDAVQFGCLVQLWDRESGWSSTAENVSSGAYGIPQALPGGKMGPGWRTDYRVQVAWGVGYIAARYGTPCGAWGSEVTRGSY